jgi:hypothetical protein
LADLAADLATTHSGVLIAPGPMDEIRAFLLE